MKKNLSIVFFCLFAFVLYGLGQPLFTVPWGEEESSIVLRYAEESDIMGAVSFTIGEDGLIYVPEAHRREIKVFDLSGELQKVIPVNIRINHLAVDASGNIFTRSDRGMVSVFTAGKKSGESLLQYQLTFSPDIVEGYGQEIHLTGHPSDGLRNAGIHTMKGEILPVFTLEKSGREIEARKAVGRSITRGRPGSNGLHYRSQWKDRQSGLVEVYNDAGAIIQKIEVPLEEGRLGVFIFKGVDNKGNIYLERERIVGRRAHLEMVVLDNSGQILEILEIPNRYYSTVYKKTHLHEGKIYQMQTTREGVVFSVWEVLK